MDWTISLEIQRIFLVYIITNTLTGTAYIGLTGQKLHRRWTYHKATAKSRKLNGPLHMAIRDYGPEVFTVEILARTTQLVEARALEQQYIALYDTYENGYNCNMGGGGNQVWLKLYKPNKPIIAKTPKEYVMSEDSRNKMSAAKVGRSECAEHFGDYTQKGANNPKAKSYLIRFPDGSERVVTGYRAFIRDHNLSAHLRCRGREKGYVFLKTFDGHPAGE